MINTGDNQNKRNNYITNVINKSNIERAQLYYSKSTIYIDSKFALPIKKYGELTLRDEKINSYVEMVIEINSLPEGIAGTLRQKIKFWFTDWKFKNTSTESNVFIDTPLSKHEWVAVAVLCNIGVNVFVVSETQSQYKLPGINYGEITCKIDELEDDGTKLNYKVTEHEVYEYNNNGEVDTNSIKSIINEFCSNVCTSATIINGWTGSEDDTVALSEILKSDETGYIIIKNKFEHPLLEDTQIISAYGQYEQISGDVARLLGRLSGDNFKDWDIPTISEAVVLTFKELESKYNISQLRNKLIVMIGVIVRLIRSPDMRHIVFLGVPGSNDSIILKVLKRSKQFNLLIVNSDLKNTVNIDEIKNVTFDKSIEHNKLLSMVESNNVAKTLAASVESSVNGILFGDNLPGVYKPGRLEYASCIRLQTTFDELNNWIHEDVFLRPGYSISNGRVMLPTMFKIVMGVRAGLDGVDDSLQCDNGSDIKQYIAYISRQFSNNTILFRSFSDLEHSLNMQSFQYNTYNPKFKIENATNKSDFIEGQTKYFDDGKLNRKAIKSSRFYNYSILSESKQSMILDVMERLLIEDYIDYTKYGVSYSTYVDTVIQILLTLHQSIVDKIHAFNFHSQAPRIIVVSATDQHSLRNLLKSAIFLCAMNFMGFDVLVYVPNSYNNLNSVYKDKFKCDIHTIGDPVVDRSVLCTIPQGITSLPALNSNCGNLYNGMDNNSDTAVTSVQISNNDFGCTMTEREPKIKKGFFKKLFNL